MRISIAPESAFMRSGRFIVTTITWPSRSTRASGIAAPVRAVREGAESRVPARDPHAWPRARHRAGPDAGIRFQSVLSPARAALASRPGAIQRRPRGGRMSGLVEASGDDGDPARSPHRAAPESLREAPGGPTHEVLHALFEAT